MQKFELTCQKVWVIVIILVFIPVLLIALMFAIIISIGLWLPDWAIIAIITLTILLCIILVIQAMKKWVNIPCEVYLSEKEILIKLKNPSIIFASNEYRASWNMLDGVSSNYEPRKSQRFYKIQFRDPYVTIYLSSLQIVLPHEETDFGILLMKYVEEYNSKEIKQVSQLMEAPLKIDTRNFYQSRGAKAFTNIILGFMLLMIIFYFAFPEKVDGWRIIQLASAGAIWFSAYYYNRRKK